MERIISNGIKSKLRKGDVLVRKVLREYPAGTVLENKYTVTKIRKAPKGLRVHAQSEFGYGVSDIDFEFVPVWGDGSNIVEIEWYLQR